MRREDEVEDEDEDEVEVEDEGEVEVEDDPDSYREKLKNSGVWLSAPDSYRDETYLVKA